jgi:16S rRNA (guanine527-N7)-methyltransferase
VPAPEGAGPLEDRLLDCWERAQTQGFLGPGPVAAHLAHAKAFAEVLAAALPTTDAVQVADLGTGAGVPGLFLALAMPTWRIALVESSIRRAALLEVAATELALSDRVHVEACPAEVVGHGSRRSTCDVVVARSFGPPAQVVECAGPLLRVGGHLVVSDQPVWDATRWPRAGLEMVGMGIATRVEGHGRGFVMIEQLHPCPDRFARRTGVPRKRPLF